MVLLLYWPCACICHQCRHYSLTHASKRHPCRGFYSATASALLTVSLALYAVLIHRRLIHASVGDRILQKKRNTHVMDSDTLREAKVKQIAMLTCTGLYFSQETRAVAQARFSVPKLTKTRVRLECKVGHQSAHGRRVSGTLQCAAAHILGRANVFCEAGKLASVGTFPLVVVKRCMFCAELGAAVDYAYLTPCGRGGAGNRGAYADAALAHSAGAGAGRVAHARWQRRCVRISVMHDLRRREKKFEVFFFLIN